MSVFSGSPPSTYTSIINAAHDLASNCAFDAAFEVLQEGLCYATDDFGENTIAHALIFSSMADIYLKSSDTGKAEHYHLEALKILKDQGYGQTSNYLLLLGKLIDCSLQRGRYDKAEQLIQKTLTLCDTIGVSVLRYRAFTLTQKAELQKALGAIDQAITTLHEASTLYSEIYSDINSEAAYTYFALGKICLEQGKHRKARALLEKALAIAVKDYGHEHEFTKEIKQNISKSNKSILIKIREIICNFKD